MTAQPIPLDIIRRTRADVVRQAVEYYLEDFEDLNSSLRIKRSAEKALAQINKPDRESSPPPRRLPLTIGDEVDLSR